MAKQSAPKKTKTRTPGRPGIDPKMKKVSLGVCAAPALIKAAKDAAWKRGESFSSYVQRAVQTQLLTEYQNP
jgi:hypothetical protein